MGGGFKDSPLDLAVQSPHRSGFQEAGDGKTKGGDTVHLSTLQAFPTFPVCGLICDSRKEEETNIPLRLGGGHACFSLVKKVSRGPSENSHRIRGNRLDC